MPKREIRVVIADDEPLARRGVRLRLERAGGFTIVGEASSGSEAVSLINALRPDAIFLDVEMPEGGGFDVVEAVGAARMPVTVFVTAYDAHAIAAFDAQALDYVLKPIDSARFERTLDRIRTRAANEEGSRRILLRDGARSILLEPEDVRWIEADGDYVRIHTRDGHLFVRHTISALEAELDGAMFARIHRSIIVNVRSVRDVAPAGDRVHRVVLVDGTVLRSSRGYRERLIAITAR